MLLDILAVTLLGAAVKSKDFIPAKEGTIWAGQDF